MRNIEFKAATSFFINKGNISKMKIALIELAETTFEEVVKISRENEGMHSFRNNNFEQIFGEEGKFEEGDLEVEGIDVFKSWVMWVMPYNNQLLIYNNKILYRITFK